MKGSFRQSPDGEDVFKVTLSRPVEETARCNVVYMDVKTLNKPGVRTVAVLYRNILAIVIRLSSIFFKED
jgi:hypothetical protein